VTVPLDPTEPGCWAGAGLLIAQNPVLSSSCDNYCVLWCEGDNTALEEDGNMMPLRDAAVACATIYRQIKRRGIIRNFALPARYSSLLRSDKLAGHNCLNGGS